ncbi:MAG TPA: hypothetical protein VFF52_28105 [Isosphaeraceae bacterium]|nr:hypothetical protein [Isosphaeraceae bacterium]
MTRRNLAALAAERGDRVAAARLWREVLAECPGDREALARLQELEARSSPDLAGASWTNAGIRG